MTIAILVVPSVTKLPPEADGAVVVGGSHAALYAGHVIAKAGARAAIHHDAGIGFEEAGVGGLALAQELGMAMAAIDASSARIGDAEDMMRRGIVSRVNALAAACGVAPGQTCAMISLGAVQSWITRPILFLLRSAAIQGLQTTYMAGAESMFLRPFPPRVRCTVFLVGFRRQ